MNPDDRDKLVQENKHLTAALIVFGAGVLSALLILVGYLVGIVK